MGFVHIITDIIIDRPLQQVASYVADPDRATEWYKNIKSVDWKTPKPLQKGSQVTFTAQFLGRKLEYTYEFVEYEPGKRVVMKTAQGPFPMETIYSWESLGENQVRMMLENKGTPSGFSAFMAPLMKMAMRNANKKDLQNLKSILEGNK